MRSSNEHENRMESESLRELRVLKEIEQVPDISQRELAQKLGMALGLTNTVLRNMVRKGLIRATKANWKRWLYAITPEGFSHKLRLTITYVKRVLEDYSEVRLALRQELNGLALHTESRIALYGTGEFAEIVFLGLKNIGINEIDSFGPDIQERPRFLGMPVSTIQHLISGYYDKVVVADLVDVADIVESLRYQGVPSERIVTFFLTSQNSGQQLALKLDEGWERAE